MSLRKIQRPVQIVFLARRNQTLYEELRHSTQGMPRIHILQWVENLHEWMGVADLLVSRAGGSTTTEALNCHLPMVVFDAPPGDERRLCQLIEKRLANRLLGEASR